MSPMRADTLQGLPHRPFYCRAFRLQASLREVEGKHRGVTNHPRTVVSSLVVRAACCPLAGVQGN
jgi:hypothetical protein